MAWLRFKTNKGLIKLNLVLLLSQASSYSCGYDTSMMNGLQALDTWQAAFNYPSPSELGLYDENPRHAIPDFLMAVR